MTVSQRSENEVVSLRKSAQEMASARRESLTTAHLLVAIAARTSSAADLLRDRRLDVDSLARLARASTDDGKDPIGQVLRRASDIARASGTREPTSIHLLVALLSQRNGAAFRAIEQSGVDVLRLRTAAMQIVGGFLEPRRTSARTTQSTLRASQPPSCIAPRKTLSKQDGPKTSAHGASTRQLAPAVASNGPSSRRVDSDSHELKRTDPQSASPVARVPSAAIIVPLFPPPHHASSAPRHAVPKSSEGNAEESSSVPAIRSRPLTKKRSTKATAVAVPISVAPAIRFELDARTFPSLHTLARNMTVAAALGELDPVVGRSIEVERILDVLAKHKANNPCLIGPPGVGKTSVVRGVAQHIIATATPRKLDDRVLVELSLPALLASTGPSASTPAAKLGSLCQELREAASRVVLFVDDIHQMFAADPSGEMTSELKSALSTGAVPMIVATTPEDYRRCIESDPGLVRCFTPIEVDEPSQRDAVEMLVAASPVLERHHCLTFDRECIDDCVNWCVRYLPERALPQKAFSVLDLAGARSRRRQRKQIGREVVADVIAEMAHMPVDRLLERDHDRILGLSDLLAARVVGHRDALDRITTIIRRNAAGFRGGRPIGSFLLLGPTGVGKTETAKAVAEALFHTADAMTRLDLSEFAEPHSVARLIGAPPGYLGHESGGQLTEAVRRRPYQVLLLDEVEKANRDVLEAFLQVLDEGRMTDGRGRTVDFSNVVIVMTSNLGAAEAMQAVQSRGIGFSRAKGGVDTQAVADVVVQAAKRALPPELYNRIDEVVAYAPLARSDVQTIAKRLLDALASKLKESRGVEVRVEDGAIDALLDGGGFDPAFGARPMKRAIARHVEAPIAELVLREGLQQGDAVRLFAGKDGVSVEVIPARPKRR